MADDNGWSEYSKLVLKELETLATSIQSLNAEIQELKQEIARMREREDRVDDLKVWKEKIDEVASPIANSSSFKRNRRPQALQNQGGHRVCRSPIWNGLHDVGNEHVWWVNIVATEDIISVDEESISSHLEPPKITVEFSSRAIFWR